MASNVKRIFQRDIKRSTKYKKSSSKSKWKFIKNNRTSFKITTIMAFVILFCYGFFFLMIGYTDNLLIKAIGLPTKYGILLAVPQSVGLVVATLFLQPLLLRFNTRTILMSSFLFVIPVLFCIAYFYKIVGLNLKTVNDVTANGVHSQFSST